MADNPQEKKKKTPEEIVAEHERLLHYDGPDRIVSAAEVWKRATAKGPASVLAKSGIDLFDDKLKGGFFAGQLIVVSGYTGEGKCHGVGTRIIMHDGTVKAVEDVVVGDLLMGDDSTPRTVLSLARGHGNLYEVTPTRGEPYVVNGDHILCLKRTKRGRGLSKTTGMRCKENMAGRIVEMPLREYRLQDVGMRHILKSYRVGVDFPKQPVPMDPYFLGLWLGDGHSSGARVTTADQEIVRFLQYYATSVGMRLRITDQPHNLSKVYAVTQGKTNRYVFSIQKQLREMGVLNNKHIPIAYRANDRGTRLELLAGLIDSDGWLNRRTGLQMVFRNTRLADDATFLCRSLGISVQRGVKVVRGRDYQRLSLSGNSLTDIPLKLDRKKVGLRLQKKDPLVSGIKVRLHGAGEYFGFTLDGNGRYLIEDFTVTHNTTLCRTLTDSFAKQGVNPLWFSYEEVEEEFLEKFPANILDFFYMPNELVDKNVKWIYERIKEGRLKYGCKVVFVDHLHYLIDLYHVKNASMEIGAIMRSLKKIAIASRIAFFLICHVGKLDRSRELQSGDTRDSALIEAESDVVMYVWRDKNKEDTSIVKITKNRKRGKVNVKAVLHFNEVLGIYDYGKEE